MDIQVTFPGGKRVDAQAGGFTIRTDQSPKNGGEGSAPEPFTLFLASLATCAGIYVASFCQARNIPTDDIRVAQSFEIDPAGTPHVRIDVQVPPWFPAEYRNAVARAAASCKVKKIIAAGPEFTVTTSVLRDEERAEVA
jgi:ribosomal protein S12 methylthiotransferase accessory factor